MQQDRDDEARARSLIAEGDECFAAGEYERALTHANAAVEAAPRLPSGLSLRAAAQDALDSVEEARDGYEEALRLEPRDVDLVADAAEFYLRRGTESRDERWLERARKLAVAGAALTTDADPSDFVSFVLLESDALVELGAPDRALARIDEAVRTLTRSMPQRGAPPAVPPTVPEELTRGTPEELRLQVERGALLFEMCRFEEARVQLEAVLRHDVRHDVSNASAHHTLGLIAERAGETANAAAHFAEAHRLDPTGFALPVVLSPGEFDRSVEDALEELPAQIRDYLANVAITVEDFPADADLFGSNPPLSPTILGLFRGSPIGDKASMDPWSHFPSSIVLYHRNLARFAQDVDELIEEIRVTLLHEVGHFVGLDEDDLHDLGVD